jgi:uncharacterized protein (TIGR02300 family)
MKAKRGTKRVCHECAARFYDLSRDPILCPSCGAHHVPAAPVVEAEGRAAPSKTSWRGRSFKRPEPASEPDPGPEAAETEDAPEEALGPATNEDVVLEVEPDDTDVSGLFDHEPEPKEG